jgi:hypothetical protein
MTSVRLIFFGTALVAAGYGAAFLPERSQALEAWALLIGMTVLLIGLMLLGARRPGASLGRLAIPLGLTAVLIAGGFAAALLLPAETAGEPLWFGLPRRAAIVVYGVGLLPVLVLPLAYARTFDTHVLRPEDLDRIRASSRQAPESGA